MSEWISTKENPDGDIKPEDIGKYTNLHAHSVYSPLDGYGKLEEYCKRAVALGMKGLCLSEHGNMIGHKEQEKMCKKYGIKPIYANEGYVTLHSGSIKEKIEGYKANYHLLLIAMNLTGYMNLMKATSIAWTRYKYFKPRFDFDLLQECQEGLICTSACLGGPINQLYLDGKAEEAEQIALRLKEIFGERFYLEKTYTGLEEQDIANKNLSEISRKHNIPMIITCDSHYVYPWQSDSHAKLVLVNTGGFINKKAKNEASLTDTKNDESDVDNNSMFYQPGQYYLKPHHVLVEEYYNTEEDAIAFENTNKIAEMCEVDLPTPEEMVFPKPYEDPDAVLRERAMQWYADYSVNLNDEDKKVYLDRLEEELITYEKMGFSSYPLVLSEILDEARAKGMMIGPGRGCSEKHLRIIVLRNNLYQYVNINDIQIGDYVIGHTGNIRKVNNIFEYNIDEPMVEIKTYYADRISRNILTKDHKILLDNKGWVKAEDIKPGDFVMLPILNSVGEKIEKIDLLDFSSGLKDLYFDDKYVSYSHGRNRVKRYKRHLLVCDEFIYFLGQFVGNGHIRRNINDDTVSICFNINHTYKAEKIISFYNKMDFDYTSRIYKSVFIIELRNKSFCMFLRNIFSEYRYSSNTKHVPDFIFGLDKNLIKEFIYGYLSTDGYYDQSKKSWKAVTVSPKLRDNFKQLCSILGYACTIYEEVREYTGIPLAEGNHSYTMTMKTPDLFDKRYCYIKDNYLCTRVQEVINYDSYNTSVYDIEVEEDHSYTTSSYIQHNSAAGSLLSYALGITSINPIPYGLIFSRYLNAGRAKYPLIEFEGYPLEEYL